jgi:hypothetical protein
VVTTLAGVPYEVGSGDGTGAEPLFGEPQGVAVNAAGVLYVADAYFNTIREVSSPTVLAQGGLTGTSSVAVSAPVTGLTPGTTYYFRAVASNVGGTTVGAIVAIPIAPSTPVLQAGSDTGPVGDDITSVRNPVFNVSGVQPGATLALLRDGAVVATVTSTSGGTVAIGDPGPLVNGRYRYTAEQTVVGNTSAPSPVLSLSIVAVQGDYTDAGKADLAVFRRVSAGLADTFIEGIVPPGGSNAFGSGTLDISLQGDLDGDGKTDVIVFRQSTGQWFTQQSTAGFHEYNFGAPGDIPVVGDFDDVGHDELAVYRPSTGQWFVGGHAGVYTTFGGPGDIPIPLRNYYGNGQDVLAVFRPSTGQWFVAGQAGGISFGAAGDIPVPLYNYYGNGRDVLAVFRPSTAQWFVGGKASGISFGGPGDIPIAADFDGIGRDELGVYRPSTGQWFVGGHATPIATFGGPSDIPLAAPYAYRALPGTSGSISAASISAPDFAASALALSSGSRQLSVFAAPIVMTTPLAAPSSKGSVISKSAAWSSPQSGRPNQVAMPPESHLHDLAIASLQSLRKRAE